MDENNKTNVSINPNVLDDDRYKLTRKDVLKVCRIIQSLVTCKFISTSPENRKEILDMLIGKAIGDPEKFNSKDPHQIEDLIIMMGVIVLFISSGVSVTTKEGSEVKSENLFLTEVIDASTDSTIMNMVDKLIEFTNVITNMTTEELEKTMDSISKGQYTGLVHASEHVHGEDCECGTNDVNDNGGEKKETVNIPKFIINKPSNYEN